MVVKEILVDGLATAEAFIDTVPEDDAGFAEFPAEVDFDSAERRGEIDEADLDILDEAAGFLHCFDGGAELGCGVIAAGFILDSLLAIDYDAA